MKKVVCMILIMMMVCNQIVSVSAVNVRSEEVISSEITYLENGDMIATTIVEYNSGIETMASYQTKTATKKSEYLNDSGEVLWSVSVTGTFRYNYGVSCECINATGSSEVFSSAWSIGTVSSRKSGNTAIASTSGTRYFVFVPLETIDLSVVLSCSSTGVLS